jgi:hypothetical protein
MSETLIRRRASQKYGKSRQHLGGDGTSCATPNGIRRRALNEERNLPFLAARMPDVDYIAFLNEAAMR